MIDARRAIRSPSNRAATHYCVRVRAHDWFGDRSLLVVDIALACCALEFESATHLSGAPGAGGIAAGETAPREIDLDDITADDPVAVVVSGTLTDRIVPVVLEICDRWPRARIISFGACASSGGPYWDSAVVTKGVGQLVGVDVFVPGCPPPPQALAEALGSLRAEALGARAEALGSLRAEPSEQVSHG